jgi:hypothetical protein
LADLVSAAVVLAERVPAAEMTNPTTHRRVVLLVPVVPRARPQAIQVAEEALPPDTVVEVPADVRPDTVVEVEVEVDLPPDTEVGVEVEVDLLQDMAAGLEAVDHRDTAEEEPVEPPLATGVVQPQSSLRLRKRQKNFRRRSTSLSVSTILK